MRVLAPLAFTVASAVALVLAAGGPVAAQSGPDVTCAGAAGHLGAARVCAPLRSLLGARYSGGAGPVTVRLELTTDDPMRLAGRLVWQVAPGAPPQTGPVVEVTSRDVPLDARAGDRLVRGLVSVSALP